MSGAPTAYGASGVPHSGGVRTDCESQPELSGLQDWSTLIDECWKAGASTVLPSGLCVGQGDFQPDGTVQRYTPGPIDDVHHGYWCTDAPHPASTAQVCTDIPPRLASLSAQARPSVYIR